MRLSKMNCAWIGCLFFFMGCAQSEIGQGTGIEHGAVKGSLDEVSRRVLSAFRVMNIETASVTNQAASRQRVFLGKTENSEVKVKVDQTGKSERAVTVDASKNMFYGDKDLAARVMSQILQPS